MTRITLICGLILIVGLSFLTTQEVRAFSYKLTFLFQLYLMLCNVFSLQRDLLVNTNKTTKQFNRNFFPSASVKVNKINYLCSYSRLFLEKASPTDPKTQTVILIQ